MLQTRKNKIRFLERKNQVLEENYHLLTDLYQKNERLYHDMNHHLQMIYHLAKKHAVSEIAEYVNSVSAPINELSDTTWSGVDIVDAILNHTVLDAKKQGIEIDVNAEFPKDCNITSDDLCVILFNLLDNAMEACQRYMQPGKNAAPYRGDAAQNPSIFNHQNTKSLRSAPQAVRDFPHHQGRRPAPRHRSAQCAGKGGKIQRQSGNGSGRRSVYRDGSVVF